jgi:hypothetical protein
MFTHFPKSKQIPGAFNGGAIRENRLVIPGHGKATAPISNLFYWAHAWSETGSLLGEHPHEAFEILTFILEGEIEHYDSHQNAWKKLSAGDVQIIRAGSGLSHAERFFPHSRIFQIWFDPELQSAMMREPSYDDYKKESFPVETMEKSSGSRIKTYRGPGAPIEMKAEDVLIKEWELEVGANEINLESGFEAVGFLRNGKIKVDEKSIEAEDGFRVNEQQVKVQVIEAAKIFIIQVPTKLSYVTYAKQSGM